MMKITLLLLTLASLVLVGCGASETVDPGPAPKFGGKVPAGLSAAGAGGPATPTTDAKTAEAK